MCECGTANGHFCHNYYRAKVLFGGRIVRVYCYEHYTIEHVIKFSARLTLTCTFSSASWKKYVTQGMLPVSQFFWISYFLKALANLMYNLTFKYIIPRHSGRKKKATWPLPNMLPKKIRSFLASFFLHKTSKGVSCEFRFLSRKSGSVAVHI